MEYWNLNWGKRRAKIGPNRLIGAKTGGTILGKNEQKCSTFKLFFVAPAQLTRRKMDKIILGR
jgi:hypothetical protein